MRKVTLLVFCGLLMLTSCGATMRLSGTAPNMDNDGTCAVPVLYPMPVLNPALRVYVSWTGPQAGQDSVAVAPGAAWSIVKTVPPGTYSVRAWAADAGGVGCDTTIAVVVKGKPGKVRMD